MSIRLWAKHFDKPRYGWNDKDRKLLNRFYINLILRANLIYCKRLRFYCINAFSMTYGNRICQIRQPTFSTKVKNRWLSIRHPVRSNESKIIYFISSFFSRVQKLVEPRDPWSYTGSVLVLGSDQDQKNLGPGKFKKYRTNSDQGRINKQSNPWIPDRVYIRRCPILVNWVHLGSIWGVVQFSQVKINYKSQVINRLVG